MLAIAFSFIFSRREHIIYHIKSFMSTANDIKACGRLKKIERARLIEIMIWVMKARNGVRPRKLGSIDHGVFICYSTEIININERDIKMSAAALIPIISAEWHIILAASLIDRYLMLMKTPDNDKCFDILSRP